MILNINIRVKVLWICTCVFKVTPKLSFLKGGFLSSKKKKRGLINMSEIGTHLLESDESYSVAVVLYL